MWYRRTLLAPAANKRLQLYLPRVYWKAKVMVDGREVGEKFNWETPCFFDLPLGVGDGKPHQLLIGVTDWTVGRRTDRSSGGRGLAAPISEKVIGLSTVPELLTVPLVRTDWAVVTPVLEPGGKKLKTHMVLKNDTTGIAPVKVNAEVFERGKRVLTVGSVDARIGPGQIASADLECSWANPKLWTPDSPNLYELRVNITANGTVIDTRSERFGFRVFGIDQGHFTLNGQRFNMQGGSHIVLAANLWPMKQHAYRLVRHGMHSEPSGFGVGRINIHLADEMGFLIKAETIAMGALHQDKYAFDLPVLWDRMYSEMASSIAVQFNHPSIVFWDVGNELFFGREGEPARMSELYRRIRAFDPTRYVTNGGGDPTPVRPELFDFHGFGEWRTRKDYFFQHPEERPSYERKGGVFAHRPENEPASEWVERTKGNLNSTEAERRGSLQHYNGRPVLFSEGFYYEDSLPPDLNGQFTYLPMPAQPESRFQYENAIHFLNMTAARKIAVQNVRQGGAAAAMIHVDRGVGRWVSPLAAFLWDRKTRFENGQRCDSVLGVHQDLAGTQKLHGRFRLWRGSAQIGEQVWECYARSGESARVPLDFSLPRVESDTTLRLGIEVWAEGWRGWFRDDQPITVFANRLIHAPKGITLAVFDPDKKLSNYLTSQSVPFRALTGLGDWSGTATEPLLIGPEALNRVPASELPHLRKKIAAGGRAIVLDHRQLPGFLSQRLVQDTNESDVCATIDPLSPLTAGLLNEDFRFWANRENDQVVHWNALIPPATGNFRMHLLGNGSTPLLEVGEGNGTVVFCQLNFQDALGIEPVAHRVLANLIEWTGKPESFRRAPTLMAGGSAEFVDGMRSRIGLVSTAKGLDDARLVVVSGVGGDALRAIKGGKEAIQRFLRSGGTLFVQGLNPDGAAALNALIGGNVEVRDFCQSGAYLTGYDPVTAGLTHGAFFWKNMVRRLNLSRSEPLDFEQPGQRVVSGAGLRPLTEPAYLAEIRVGEGRVLLCTLRSLEQPLPAARRVLSALLSNCGAKLDPNGIATNRSAWVCQPVDLTRYANLSLTGNDMETLPVGRQPFKGITYELPDPRKTKGRGALSFQVGSPGVLPREIKGIMVNQKAERLYFLHTLLAGNPSPIYRVYYLEDRRAWIFGKPDPFTDIAVRPGENILGWPVAGKVERGELFAGGCTVAWSGTTARVNGGERAGLYHMVWDNPFPDKTIESVDLLLPSAAQPGRVALLGITAAVRGAVAGKLPLGAVAPKLSADAVFDQFQNSRYGLILNKNGTVPVIYDNSGRALFHLDGWSMQCAREKADGKMEFWMADEQINHKPRIDSSTDDGGNRVFRIQGSGRFIDWSQRIVCLPTRLRCEIEVTVTRPMEKPEPSLTFSLGADGRLTGTMARVNENPVPVPFESGLATVTFDDRYRSWFRRYAVRDQGISFSPFAVGQREVGAKTTLWYEVELP